MSETSSSFAAGGGAGRVNVAAERECQWSAAAQADWIALVAPTEGQGDGAVQYTVQANAVPTPRQGSIVVEGKTVEIAQEAAPCTYELDRRSDEQPSGGGTGSVGVRTHAVCRWSASSDASWLTITDGREGTGPATVRYSVAPNPGAARRARLTIAGRTIDVLQAASAPGDPAPAPGPAPPPEPPPEPPSPPPAPTPCTYELTPVEASVESAASTGTVRVSSRSDCTWSATSSVPWVRITSGASGTGTGEIRYAVDANAGTAERSGTISVGDSTVRLRQAGAAPAPPPPPPDDPPPPPEECDYDIEPGSRSLPAEGGAGTVAVRTGSECSWSASADASWITIESGASGSGTGEVRYTVAANESDRRTATLTVAGRAHTVEQEGGTPAEVSLNGELSDLQGSCPAVSFTVQRTRVIVNESTTITRGNCRHLAGGVRVQVTGVRQPDDSVLASRVEIQRDDIVGE